jgi:hypothetical protein
VVLEACVGVYLDSSLSMRDVTRKDRFEKLEILVHCVFVSVSGKATF